MEVFYYSPPEAYSAEPPTWLEHRSAHFVFHFLSGSDAEQSIELIAARLESTWAATATLLELADAPGTPIDVFLTDSDLAPRLIEPPRPPEPAGSAIRAPFGADAPGEGIERAVVELLLIGAPADSSEGAASLVDGLLGCVTGLSPERAAAETKAALIARREQGQAIALTEVLGGSTTDAARLSPAVSGSSSRVSRETRDDRRETQIATSFVAFLLTRYGSAGFKQFARAARAGEPATAAQAAYGKPLPVLEKEWLASLHDRRLYLIGLSGLLGPTLGLLRPHSGLALLSLLAMLPFVAYRTLQPLVFKSMIDDGLAAGSPTVITRLIAVLAGLAIAQAVGFMIRDYLVARLGVQVMNALRFGVLGHLRRMSRSFYARARVGDLLSSLSTDLEAVEHGVSFVLPVSLQYALVGLVSVALLFTQQALLALISLATLLIFYLGFQFVGPLSARAGYRRQEEAAQVLSTVQEYLAGHSVVEAFGLDERMFARLRDQLARLARATVRVGIFSGVVELTTTGAGAALTAVSMSLGAVMVLQGQLSLGTLVAFVGLVGQITSPIEWLAKMIQPAERASGALQRLNQMLAEQPELVDPPLGAALPPVSREIRFDNVTFSYTGELVNLNSVSLQIPACQFVAIVGRSGCGKSTLINLLMRLYDPTVGSVSIDGHDLRQVTRASLRGQIGVVFQESLLLDTTIRENIRLGRPEASDDEVMAVAQAAEVHDFVTELPDGYDTIVGEGGGRLSAGERQRVAIARAILRDPSILLLDEPTAALDTETEARINATLDRLAEGRTVIWATHRLASAARADRIIVLQRGNVIEDGTHEELIRGKGLYFRLWQQQRGFVVSEGGRRVEVDAARLRAIPLFANLDRVHLAALADRFVTERYSEARTIFEEGDPGDKLYIIVHGSVEVLKSTAGGAARRLAVLQDGDFFGEIALLEDVPRTATIVTRTPCLMLTLGHQQFGEVLATFPELRTAFEQAAAVRRGQQTEAGRAEPAHDR